MKNCQEKLTSLISEYISNRDWSQFHSGKDFAISLSVEANEVLELFLWKDSKQVDKSALKDEIGDVFYCLLLLCKTYDINLEDALIDKLKINEKKYPADKFHGINKKYSEVE